ncbi:MAG: hypothetical protein FWG66_14075 [Spirochaetes bacterium]|nr:hypothetical protein [Spirochaetota bacterium]
MVFGPYQMVLDFAFAAMLLFLAKLVRSRIRFVQRLYIPSAVIAGLLGLFFGPQFLDIIPFSGQIATYPFLLIVFLFSSLFIGNKAGTSVKKIFSDVGDTFAINLAVQVLFFGVFVLVAPFILAALFPGLHPWFALLVPTGFIGGHGYAAAIGGALIGGGWEDALTIGQTFATIGLLTGVIGGVILINFAVRKGATRFVKSMTDVSDDIRTGLVAEESRESMGSSTVNPMSIDPLGWHLVPILIAFAGGYYATNFLNSILPISAPMMSVAMICGVIMNLVLRLLRLNNYVDKKIVTRIGSTSTDFLVTFGVSAISITVVVEFALPIIFMSILAVLFTLLWLAFISRRLFRKFWFERGIFIYGYTNGVVATGVTLLRVVDPEFRSKTLEDYGTAYALIGIIEVVLISLLPILIMQGLGFATGGILTAIGAVILIICAKVYGINRNKANKPTEAELEVMNSSKS